MAKITDPKFHTKHGHIKAYVAGEDLEVNDCVMIDPSDPERVIKWDSDPKNCPIGAVVYKNINQDCNVSIKCLDALTLKELLGSGAIGVPPHNICDHADIPKDTGGKEQFICITDGKCSYLNKEDVIALYETLTKLEENTNCELVYTDEVGTSNVVSDLKRFVAGITITSACALQLRDKLGNIIATTATLPVGLQGASIIAGCVLRIVDGKGSQFDVPLKPLDQTLAFNSATCEYTLTDCEGNAKDSVPVPLQKLFTDYSDGSKCIIGITDYKGDSLSEIELPQFIAGIKENFDDCIYEILDKNGDTVQKLPMPQYDLVNDANNCTLTWVNKDGTKTIWKTVKDCIQSDNELHDFCITDDGCVVGSSYGQGTFAEDKINLILGVNEDGKFVEHKPDICLFEPFFNAPKLDAGILCISSDGTGNVSKKLIEKSDLPEQPCIRHDANNYACVDTNEFNVHINGDDVFTVTDDSICHNGIPLAPTVNTFQTVKVDPNGCLFRDTASAGMLNKEICSGVFHNCSSRTGWWSGTAEWVPVNTTNTGTVQLNDWTNLGSSVVSPNCITDLTFTADLGMVYTIMRRMRMWFWVDYRLLINGGAVLTRTFDNYFYHSETSDTNPDVIEPIQYTLHKLGASIDHRDNVPAGATVQVQVRSRVNFNGAQASAYGRVLAGLRGQTIYQFSPNQYLTDVDLV